MLFVFSLFVCFVLFCILFLFLFLFCFGLFCLVPFFVCLFVFVAVACVYTAICFSYLELINETRSIPVEEFDILTELF